MNDLVTYEKQLPDTIEDLSKFVLIGTEKLVAMKAEIRAITKCNFAKEIYEQKMDEQRMLSELILDASVKIGELTKAMPKATKGNQYTGKVVTDTVVANQKTKTERISDLGFSPKQVERFEILANNKDIVEQVKAEARENDDIPTRSRVIDIVKRKKQESETDDLQDAENRKIFREYLDMVYAVNTYKITEKTISSIVSRLVGALSVKDEVQNIEEAISKLTVLKNKIIMEGVKQNGKI